MRSYDFSPLWRSTVGFDRLFDFLETSGSGAENYPPFDIERLGDDHFRITVAVAGFKSDEIDIIAQQNMLTVSGRKTPVAEGEGRQLLYSGIATRAFERRFQLADHVRAVEAVTENGQQALVAIVEGVPGVQPSEGAQFTQAAVESVLPGWGAGFVAVALAGAFCASIAIFGRDRRAIPR